VRRCERRRAAFGRARPPRSGDGAVAVWHAQHAAGDVVGPAGGRVDRGDNGYELLLLLHILGVVIGFGSVVLNGLYGAEARKRRGPGGVAIGEANYAVSNVAEYFIYSVPITGIALVLVSDVWEFDETWVWLSIVLYVVGLGISHGSQIPSARRLVLAGGFVRRQA
jgi:drug/metabolite transporter (DMT)-like permease